MYGGKSLTIGKLKEIGKKQLENLEDGNIKAHILLEFILNMSNSELVIYENKSVDEQDLNTYLQYLDEVKEKANYITASNNDDGVAKAIKKFIFNEVE